MKKYIVIIILLISIISCKEDTSDEPFYGIVSFILNKVQKTEDGDWEKVNLLDKINFMKIVRTLDNSKAEINVYNNKYRIVLLEKTIFIPKNISFKNTKFELKQGSLFARIKKLTDEQSFTIVTPTATIGVRGTDFSVNSTAGIDKISVREGTVNVKYNLNNLKKALQHQNESIKSFARLINKGVKISSYKSISINKTLINTLEKKLTEVLQNQDNLEKKLQELTRLAEYKIGNAETSDFTTGLKFLHSNPDVKNGKPVILNGNNENTKIFINNNLVGKGYYAKLFPPGSYTFKFTLGQHEHNVMRIFKEDDKEVAHINAPFKTINIRPPQNRDTGPYEANPEGRAAD